MVKYHTTGQMENWYYGDLKKVLDWMILVWDRVSKETIAN